MEELMTAFKKKFGEDVGIVIYLDMSGYLFKVTGKNNEECNRNAIFDFDNIMSLTTEDIYQNRTVNHRE